MTPQDYITKRLAELRDDMPDPVSCPTLSVAQHSAIAELEAMQAHLSQSTRPEVSIGGQYSVDLGHATAYLRDQHGFVIASNGLPFAQDIQKLASDLNQLEALRASHGELMAALRLAAPHIPSNAIDAAMAESNPVNLCWVTGILQQALSRAQSLTDSIKTPTAAPQGQQ